MFTNESQPKANNLKVAVAAVLVFAAIVAVVIVYMAVSHRQEMASMLEAQNEREARLAQQQRTMLNLQEEIEQITTGHTLAVEAMAAELDELQDMIDELIVGLPSGITTDTVLSSVRQVAELTTLVHEYVDITIQDESNFWTRRLLIIRYAGRVRVGIDFRDIIVEVRGNTIDITLPQARIFSHELPFETIEVVRDETGLFTPSNTIPDFVALMEGIQRNKEIDLVSGGILTDARLNAQETVRQMVYAIILAQRGNPADYLIVFR